jgi:hypothetical protein
MSVNGIRKSSSSSSGGGHHGERESVLLFYFLTRRPARVIHLLWPLISSRESSLVDSGVPERYAVLSDTPKSVLYTLCAVYSLTRTHTYKRDTLVVVKKLFLIFVKAEVKCLLSQCNISRLYTRFDSFFLLESSSCIVIRHA